MSMEALLVAVADRVREACGYSVAQCDVQPDGKPPVSAGQVYVAVHGVGVDNADDSPHELDEAFSVTVTVTMRTGHIPRDRAGKAVAAKASTGIWARCEAIRAAVHGNYDVMNAANEQIGDADNGFIRPLSERGISGMAERWADWFGAEQGDAGRAAGWSMDVFFVQAQRVQKLEEQS